MQGKFPKLYEIEYENIPEEKIQRTFSVYKIWIVTKGRGVCKINDRQVAVMEGDIFLMSNTDKRCFIHVSEKIRMIILEIEPKNLDKMFVPLFKKRTTHLPRSFSITKVPEFEKYIKNALKETNKKNDYANYYIENSVNLALTELLRAFSKRIKKEEKEMKKEIAEMLEYIEKNLEKEISLKEIAKLNKISPSALCKQFKKNVGVGFSKYVSQKRVEKVIEIITENKDIKVLDAAYSCGFRNSAAFYEAFKKNTGTTPLKIRKNLVYTL